MKTQLFLIFIISSITLYSQNFFIEWKQCFGGDGFDSPNHIITTTTGTMICAHTTSDDGSATNFHGGECSDAWVISLDTFGNVLWEKCYGGTAIDKYPPYQPRVGCCV